MKVAIYAGMFKENHDGAVKTLYELVDSLLQKEIELGVWGFSITPQQRKGLTLYNIASIPLPLYKDYRITLPNHKLKKQLKKFNPDVMHITVPDLVGMSLMRFARKKGIPVLTSYHTDFPSYLKSYGLGFFYNPSWKYFKWFYNKSRVTLAPTEEIIDKLKSKGIKHTKLWSRGIHLDRYSMAFRSQSLRSKWKARGKMVILYSGRFVWYKDLETFIEVYHLFKTRGPRDVVFVLAGDGPIREELVKRMPDAIFPGYLEGEELSRVYASSDILLFPSTTETFGNVVLEAMASGLPAVVSDVGGCKEIVRRSGAGLVAKAGDPGDFYRKCQQLVKDQNLYKGMQQKGLRFAQTRSWQTINNRVIDEYRYLIRSKEKTLRAGTGILVSDY
ncbi:MAG: glycosyltransferase family 1 protein [Candidatus Aminicenantes bacterium]|nr:MAG: glycosyltransferase family 1 protein [Candidatus Aminicenantes bacterium]